MAFGHGIYSLALVRYSRPGRLRYMAFRPCDILAALVRYTRLRSCDIAACGGCDIRPVGPCDIAALGRLRYTARWAVLRPSGVQRQPPPSTRKGHAISVTLLRRERLCCTRKGHAISVTLLRRERLCCDEGGSCPEGRRPLMNCPGQFYSWSEARIQGAANS